MRISELELLLIIDLFGWFSNCSQELDGIASNIWLSRQTGILGDRSGAGSIMMSIAAPGLYYLNPSSFFASSFFKPPTLGKGRPESVTTNATTISSPLGAS